LTAFGTVSVPGTSLIRPPETRLENGSQRGEEVGQAVRYRREEIADVVNDMRSAGRVFDHKKQKEGDG
jgi:hypothetical protein